jgi:hypothetical protein
MVCIVKIHGSKDAIRYLFDALEFDNHTDKLENTLIGKFEDTLISVYFDDYTDDLPEAREGLDALIEFIKSTNLPLEYYEILKVEGVKPVLKNYFKTNVI